MLRFISVRRVLTAGYKYSIASKLYPYCTILYLPCECPVLYSTHHIEMHHLSEADFKSRLQTRREVVLCLHQHPVRSWRDIIIIIIIWCPSDIDIMIIIWCPCDIINTPSAHRMTSSSSSLSFAVHVTNSLSSFDVRVTSTSSDDHHHNVFHIFHQSSIARLLSAWHHHTKNLFRDLHCSNLTQMFF